MPVARKLWLVTPASPIVAVRRFTVVQQIILVSGSLVIFSPFLSHLLKSHLDGLASYSGPAFPARAKNALK